MEKKKVNKKVVEQLKNKSEDLVLAAIKKIREEGFSDYIEPLCALYIDNKDQKIRTKITALFEDLKDSKSRQTIIDILLQTESNELRSMLLTSCWSSSLDYSEYLTDFIEIAIRHDYMTAFEALTVIDNFETIPSKNKIDQSISTLKSHASDDTSEKQQILIELIKVLESFLK